MRQPQGDRLRGGLRAARLRQLQQVFKHLNVFSRSLTPGKLAHDVFPAVLSQLASNFPIRGQITNGIH
jgi:hypothetical protein